MTTPERRMTRRSLVAATGGLLATFAGCISDTAGGDQQTTTTAHDEESNGDHEEDDGHGHGQVGDQVQSATVAVNTTDDGEDHYTPHVTWITEGGTVTWVLESGAHTATAYHPGNDQPQLVPDGTEAWDSGMLSEVGEEFEYTFEVPGVYHYYCIPHETGGMIGTVIVGDPDPHDQQALASVPEEKPTAVREKLEALNESVRTALGDDHEDEGSGDHEDDGHDTSDTDHNETDDDHDGTSDHENETEETHNETDDNHD